MIDVDKKKKLFCANELITRFCKMLICVNVFVFHFYEIIFFSSVFFMDDRRIVCI